MNSTTSDGHGHEANARAGRQPTLHVEANGGQPACDMTFYRAETSAVTIGRKSSSDHRFGRGDDGLANAGFACQVVSGRHAKLAFSDSGYVSVSMCNHVYAR